MLRMLAVVATLTRYYVIVWPQARCELRRWRAQAEAIPDPPLRRLAVATHDEEHMNAEGAAIFATLAPWSVTRNLVSLTVAYQVLFDYLDTITEEPPARPGDTRRLHLALLDALSPDENQGAWRALHPQREDGGYVEGLIERCRAAAACLPAFGVVAEPARRAARRSGEVQAHNHFPVARSRDLQIWAGRHADLMEGLEWWEFAASSSSSLPVHLLFALGAQTSTTSADADFVEREYGVALGALNTLLEALIDQAEDERTGAHNFVAYYDDDEASTRMRHLARRARHAAGSVPSAPRQLVILAGMVSFYLSTKAAQGAENRKIARGVLEAIGTPAPALVGVLRLRRRLGAA